MTVVFPKPSDKTIKEWQIAPYRDIAHIITMPHVSRELVDELIDEIAKA